MTSAIKTLESITPSVLFAVFLPALITPSGINLRWHMVRLTLDKALILAIVGTSFNAALIAVVARFVFPYNWSWAACWLMASILAATDPVAVVAIMHSAAASAKLATIVEGESLLNDGVAYVLFEIFRGWAAGENVTAGGVVSFVAKACLGSPALGYVWAIALTIWFVLLFSDAVAEVMASVVAAYALWQVCDEMLHLSGILALVVFSTAIGAFGKYRVSRSAAHSFDHFWSYIEWTANTLIFFLSGLIIAIELTDAVGTLKVIQARDWGYAVVLFLLMFVIRSLGIVLLYPLLRRGTYGVDWRDAVMLSWAGLRGAVGLTLSLIVYNSQDIQDEEYRQKQFFFVAFAAVSTLILQGSTTSVMLRFLGYLDLPPTKLSAMTRCAEAVEVLGRRGVRRAKVAHALLGDADWNQVKQLTDLGILKKLDNRPTLNTRRRRFKRTNRVVKITEHAADATAAAERAALLADLRKRLLQAVTAQYAEAFESELLTPHEVHRLFDGTERALDETDGGLIDWRYLSQKMVSLDSLGRQPQGAFHRLLFIIRGHHSFAGRDATLAATFACAHAAARKDLQTFADLELGGLQIENPEGDNNSNSNTAENGGDSAAPASPRYGYRLNSGVDNQKSLEATTATADGTIGNTSGASSSGEGTPSPSHFYHHPHHHQHQHTHRDHNQLADTGAGESPKDDQNVDNLKPFWQYNDEGDPDPVIEASRALRQGRPSMLRRLATSLRGTVEELVSCLDQVLEESREEQRLAESHILELRKRHPKAVRAARTAQVSTAALHRERELLERLERQGLLEEREVGGALETVEGRLKTLHWQIALGKLGGED